MKERRTRRGYQQAALREPKASSRLHDHPRNRSAPSSNLWQHLNVRQKYSYTIYEWMTNTGLRSETSSVALTPSASFAACGNQGRSQRIRFIGSKASMIGFHFRRLSIFLSRINRRHHRHCLPSHKSFILLRRSPNNKPADARGSL